MIHSIKSKQIYQTYPLVIFEILKEYFDATLDIIDNEPSSIVPYYTYLHAELKTFISKTNWESKWNELRRHTASCHQLKRRFFQWFDPFKMMKFCNYMRDERLGSSDVYTTASLFLEKTRPDVSVPGSHLALLNCYRSLQKSRQ